MSDTTATAAPVPSKTRTIDPQSETQAAYALIVSKYVMWIAIATSILTAILWLLPPTPTPRPRPRPRRPYPRPYPCAPAPTPTPDSPTPYPKPSTPFL